MQFYGKEKIRTLLRFLPNNIYLRWISEDLHGQLGQLTARHIDWDTVSRGPNVMFKDAWAMPIYKETRIKKEFEFPGSQDESAGSRETYSIT